MSNAADVNREAGADCLQIGNLQFHVASHELSGDGVITRLEPRAAGLLHYLALRAGQPVSRTELLEALWPGMVVSDEALTNAVNKLRRAFGDDRTNPRVIETIPKAGYRLIAHVQSCTNTTSPSLPEEYRAAKPTRRRLRWLLPATVVVMAVGIIALFIGHPHLAGNKPAGERPSAEVRIGSGKARPALAVMPFDNLGGNPDEEYFVDGITDDVITRLAKNPGLMVIARDSTFFYKGKSLDPGTVAESLGVGYLLRGSIRREADLLKINVWLIDAASGAHLWAEHYDLGVDRAFDIQSRIALHVTRALAVGPGEQQDTLLRETAVPLAYDNLLLGRHHFYKFESASENLKARTCFEEAIRLDDGFATAYAMLAWTYAFAAMNGWTDDRDAALQRAENSADRALAIQPRHPLARFVRGLAYRERHEYIKAMAEAQQCIEYDPNDANCRVLLATLLYYAGRPEDGLELIREAMQINPHHPYNYHFHLGQAYFVLHRYREAIDALRHGLASNPASERMHVWLAASLAQAGDTESAQWEAEQVRTADPDFSLQRIAEAFPFKEPGDLEHFLAALRQAGLE